MRIFLAIITISLNFLTSCSDPSQAVINVTTTTGGNADISSLLGNGPTTYTPIVTEKFSVKLSDFDWEKIGGVWIGRPLGGGLPHKPADEEAVKAIERYMNL